MLKELQATRDVFNKLEEHDRELAFIKNKFNDYVLKSDLYEMILAADSSRQVEVRPPGMIAAQNSDFGAKSPYRQRSAHVKLINGDSLKRPFTTGRRLRAYDE